LTYFSLKNGEKKEAFKVYVSRQKPEYKNTLELSQNCAMCTLTKLGTYDVVSTISDTVPPDFCINYSLIHNHLQYTLHVPNLQLKAGWESACKFNIDPISILSTFRFLE